MSHGIKGPVAPCFKLSDTKTRLYANKNNLAAKDRTAMQYKEELLTAQARGDRLEHMEGLRA